MFKSVSYRCFFSLKWCKYEFNIENQKKILIRLVLKTILTFRLDVLGKRLRHFSSLLENKPLKTKLDKKLTVRQIMRLKYFYHNLKYSAVEICKCVIKIGQ